MQLCAVRRSAAELSGGVALPLEAPEARLEGKLGTCGRIVGGVGESRAWA